MAGCPFELEVVRDGEEADVEKFKSSRERETQDPPFQTKGGALGKNLTKFSGAAFL
jgi:hypothetical protein